VQDCTTATQLSCHNFLTKCYHQSSLNTLLSWPCCMQQRLCREGFLHCNMCHIGRRPCSMHCMIPLLKLLTCLSAIPASPQPHRYLQSMTHSEVPDDNAQQLKP
jgi:hypothetical protein